MVRQPHFFRWKRYRLAPLPGRRRPPSAPLPAQLALACFPLTHPSAPPAQQTTHTPYPLKTQDHRTLSQSFNRIIPTARQSQSSSSWLYPAQVSLANCLTCPVPSYTASHHSNTHRHNPTQSGPDLEWRATHWRQTFTRNIPKQQGSQRVWEDQGWHSHQYDWLTPDWFMKCSCHFHIAVLKAVLYVQGWLLLFKLPQVKLIPFPKIFTEYCAPPFHKTYIQMCQMNLFQHIVFILINNVV